MPENTVFAGVGSNVDPEQNIAIALTLLASIATVDAVSMFYRTAALRRPELPPFLNGVIRLRTELDALTLKFEVLCGIESAIGRARRAGRADAYGSRTIDLDILLFNSEIIDVTELRVPAPDIRERPFVAVPLLELAPDLVLPGTGERLADLPCAGRREELIPVEAFTKALRERLGL